MAIPTLPKADAGPKPPDKGAGPVPDIPTQTGVPGIMTGAMPQQPDTPQIGGMPLTPPQPDIPQAQPAPGPPMDDSELLDLPDVKEPEPFDPKAVTEHASGASFQEMLDLPDVPWWKRGQPPGPQQSASGPAPAQPQMTLDTGAILEAIQNLPPDNPLWKLVPLFLRGGYQESGAGVLPLGDYRMPDGSTDTGIGLPQGLLDAWRTMRMGLGFEQDPNAPQGYISQDQMLKGAVGGAGSAITGSFAAGAARAMKGGIPKHLSSESAPPEPPAGITAYHGSPHDFDKFDISKIGTGEGAQAYGHGLYFAESKGVAKSYRDNLTDGASVAPPGRLYKVTINAKPEQFLDWDKPLSQQSDAIRSAMKPVLEQAAKAARINAWGDNVRPEHVITVPGLDQVAATKYLRKAGIPGIRYLDQGSRTDGKGTYNYVLFDDSLVKIAEKYGFVIPGPSGMPAVSEDNFEKLKKIAKDGAN